MSLSELVSAVFRAAPAPGGEPPTPSLLTEVKRLPNLYHLMDVESDIEAMRIIYRTGDVQTAGFGMMDLFAMKRVEDTAERFVIRLVREFNFKQLEAEKFVDYTWNFRWVLLNTRTRRYSMEQSLKRILDAVDLSVNELIIEG